jgi:hypothetical protein
VAVKKAKRPTLRYLLSADARLRKLSLKKLSQGRKKATGPKRASRSKAPVVRPAESPAWVWTAKSRALALTGIGVLAAGTLFAAGQMSDNVDSEAAVVMRASEPRMTSGSPTASIPLEQPVEKHVDTPAPSRLRSPERTKSPAAPLPLGVKTPSPSAITSEAPESVTVTGCLVKNSDGFSLKDASGADLSKARSWRTGFFKKRSPRLDVVAASSTVKLPDYVGQRVSANGVLTDNALRARALRLVGSTCR